MAFLLGGCLSAGILGDRAQPMTLPTALVAPEFRVASVAPTAPAANSPGNGMCFTMTSTASDSWCQSTCIGSKVQAPGCSTLCCCDESCKARVDEQRKLDRITKFTGKNGQCHFHQCSKEICPADKCVSEEWNANCTGPRPVVYLNDGPHSGSKIITSALANFTGSFIDQKVQQWPEVMGTNEAKSRELQSPVKFMAQFFCNARRMDPNGTLAGFKWNTFGHRYVDTNEFDEVWKELAQNKVPILHVLRSDMSSIISTAKHDIPNPTKKNITVKIPVSKQVGLVDKPTLRERLEHLDKGRAWLESKYTNMGASVKVSSFELLLHSHAQTRLNEWKRILSFYGANDAAQKLSLTQLDKFLEGYKKSHGHDERPYDEVVSNWKDVEEELNRMKRSFRVSLATRAKPILPAHPITPTPPAPAAKPAKAAKPAPAAKPAQAGKHADAKPVSTKHLHLAAPAPAAKPGPAGKNAAQKAAAPPGKHVQAAPAGKHAAPPPAGKLRPLVPAAPAKPPPAKAAPAKAAPAKAAPAKAAPAKAGAKPADATAANAKGAKPQPAQPPPAKQAHPMQPIKDAAWAKAHPKRANEAADWAKAHPKLAKERNGGL